MSSSPVRAVEAQAGLTIQPPPPARAMVSARLRADNALGIPIATWNASGSRHGVLPEGGAVIVGVHSFGDYRMGFDEIAEPLTTRGHMLVAYDQSGFGATPARGRYASDDIYREHLAHVVRFARGLAGSRRPLVVMAESFGASVAISAAARGMIGIDGLILSGPGVRENLPAKPLWDGLISAASNLLGPRKVRLPLAGEEMSDTARLRFASDPMVLRDLRADTYEKVVALADLASLEASRIATPTLVLYGEKDSLIARASIDALMNRLGPRGELKVYEERAHLLLQARRRDDIERDVLAFLDRLRA